MMQGDSYFLGFAVHNNAGEPITPGDLQDMEITVGSIRRTYREGGLTYHEGKWLLPLSQQETFSLWPSAQKAQVRLLWNNGVLEGKPIYGLKLHESISREVL